jgi:hypothetical protein
VLDCLIKTLALDDIRHVDHVFSQRISAVSTLSLAENVCEDAPRQEVLIDREEYSSHATRRSARLLKTSHHLLAHEVRLRI